MNWATRNRSRFWTPRVKTDLRERSADERAQSQKASIEHVRRASRDAHIPGLEHLERHDRGIHQVPQFMSQKSKSLAPAIDLAIQGRLISLASILGDGARDGVVEAAVQHAKIIRRDGRIHFHGELRDRLAHVAIVVHDLRHREPLSQQVVPVLNRARGNLGGPVTQTQCVHELLQEHGHSVIDLRLGRLRNRPRRHFVPASSDELVAVCANEFVQHLLLPLATVSNRARLFSPPWTDCVLGVVSSRAGGTQRRQA